jgi:hypothetical protein
MRDSTQDPSGVGCLGWILTQLFPANFFRSIPINGREDDSLSVCHSKTLDRDLVTGRLSFPLDCDKANIGPTTVRIKLFHHLSDPFMDPIGGVDPIQSHGIQDVIVPTPAKRSPE